MTFELTAEQQARHAAFREFADREIAPHAGRFDREQQLPPELFESLAKRGYLGAIIPRDQGGSGLDHISYGLLHEETAGASASVQSLLTVQGIVAASLMRWGSKRQKAHWLPRMASGEVRGSFALSEPNVGSDARNVETSARRVPGGYVLNGVKTWISHGQTANVFLVFGQAEDGPCAFLIERETPGLTIEPIHNMFGSRASMLARLTFSNCEIGEDCRVSREGFGFSHVAASALDHGRYCVAWGSVGIAQACLNTSVQYTRTRKQFGVFIEQHPLVRQKLTSMIANVKAARLLCFEAGYGKDTGSADAIVSTMIAKYFASTAATSIALDAVQLHGANGLSEAFPVERYLRDAKVMEVIEGSTQILETAIAKYYSPAVDAAGAGAR